MPLVLSGDDAARLKALLALSEENLRALEWFSGYLNLCPRFVSDEDVKTLTRECDVSGEEAYRLLMASACGLDIAGDPWARRMAERYFRPGVRCLDAAACRADRTMPPCACQRRDRGTGRWDTSVSRPLRPLPRAICSFWPTGARCP